MVVLIDLRHTDSSQPAWQFSWPRSWYPIVHRKEYDRLAREGVYTLSRDWWTATGTVFPADWRANPHRATIEAISDPLGSLGRSGVMGQLVAEGT